MALDTMVREFGEQGRVPDRAKSTRYVEGRGSQPGGNSSPWGNFRVSGGNWDHRLADSNCWNIDLSTNYNSTDCT